jgi:hypothetical protein
MRTVGVDLSADPKKTALARVAWEGGAARVELVRVGVDDEALAAAIGGAAAGAAEHCGIDSPLGWPRAMAEAVAAHSRGGRWPDLSKDEFRHRRTDRFVIAETRARTGTALHPLSVAADRIALPAWRIAGVRAGLAAPGSPGFDLAGGDGVYEVYPAAALLLWGFDRERRGYKRADAEGRRARAAILRALGRAAPWLTWDRAARAACLDTDHALDAVLASLVTRAAATGRTVPPPPEDEAAAEAEGWIHLPAPGVSLGDLAARE